LRSQGATHKAAQFFDQGWKSVNHEAFDATWKVDESDNPLEASTWRLSGRMLAWTSDEITIRKCPMCSSPRRTWVKRTPVRAMATMRDVSSSRLSHHLQEAAMALHPVEFRVRAARDPNILRYIIGMARPHGSCASAKRPVSHKRNIILEASLLSILAPWQLPLQFIPLPFCSNLLVVTSHQCTYSERLIQAESLLGQDMHDPYRRAAHSIRLTFACAVLSSRPLRAMDLPFTHFAILHTRQ
jgi:hypothetical protein